MTYIISKAYKNINIEMPYITIKVTVGMSRCLRLALSVNLNVFCTLKMRFVLSNKCFWVTHTRW